MTMLSKVMGLFPAFIMLLLLGCAGWALFAPSLWILPAVLFVLYLLPPLAYRLHDRFWRVKLGRRSIAEHRYEPWWGAHQCQLIYIAVPHLEALLRILPGVYSAWLRLWGSKIRRGVHWTPRIDVADRNLLEIGDRVVIGHRATLVSHVITPKRSSKLESGRDLLLFVRPVVLRSGCLIGGGAVLGPGVTVMEDGFVEAGKHIYPGKTVK